MNRKRKNETSNNNFINKRKSANNTNKDSIEKTLLDYWKPKQNKKESKKVKSKSRSVSQEKENEIGKMSKSSKGSNSSKSHVLVKNPSKQALVLNNLLKDSMMDYKKKILFSEEFVGNLKLILEPFVKETEKSLFSQKVYKSLFNHESYQNFIQENFDSVLIKFLMQVSSSDDFVYVPLSFTSKNGESADKSKLKLIEGFNDSKKLNLQYHASNSK
jgi:hypothetical protein